MQPLPLDTSPDALNKMHEFARALSPSERLEKLLSLMSCLAELAIAAIRAEDPDISKKELYLRYAERLHGREIAETVFRQIADAKFPNDV
ncbi:MAG: hypothetical protein IT291_09805 [Deltaproteobacteria bacterium]|nr:hypothetical protein [Deltaproteobacteria bacterium]